MTISACLPTLNEEERIESTLISFQWCDEIIVIDKNSTDRTVQIAEKYGARIYPFTEKKGEFNTEELDVLKSTRGEWTIGITASDVIDVLLAMEIKRLLSLKDFPYDVIHVPFKRVVLGFSGDHSPWRSGLVPYIYRKSAMQLNYKSVHKTVSYSETSRHYYIKNSDIGFLYHLTHATVDGMMDRHIRYWHGEARYYDQPSMWQAFKAIVKSFLIVIYKRTILLGWDGIMLSCAFISYYMMSFVYIWEKKYSKAPQQYRDLRDKIDNDWKQARDSSKGKA
jgi:glycosyltransferase involved in cell wall biosynthesis